MSRCKLGDVCEVIGGALTLGNLGKIVEVVNWQGEHSKYGTIWHCHARNELLVTEYGAVGNQADFADDWLRPLAPKELNRGRVAANEERFAA